MSYGIMAFAVSLDRVESVLASAKRGLLGRLFGTPTDSLMKTLKQKFAYRFEEDEDDFDEEDEEETLTLEQALVDLLHGNKLNSSFGHKYGYALELLCDHFGESLDNSAWDAMGVDWAVQVEEEMQQAGIDENTISPMGHLMFRGPPIQIPKPEDSPAIGFLRSSEIDRAASAIDGADPSNMDEEAAESVMQIRAWLRRCEQLNCDLVCFYH
jgi:hypothetical protein